MTVKTMSRQQLLEHANRLFRTQGYSNTSVADIAGACNLSKGSIYHYIDSKKELALSVLKQQQDYYSEHLFSIAYDETLSPTERLKVFSDKVESIYHEHQGRSIMIQLALESSDVLVEFQSFFKGFFKKWLDAVKHMLPSSFSAAQLDERARSIVSEIHGAMVLSFVFADDSILQASVKRLITV
jgi:TetR/AcrR family transcriptional regulator, lmrAB and yxaGH operons repressor